MILAQCDGKARQDGHPAVTGEAAISERVPRLAQATISIKVMAAGHPGVRGGGEGVRIGAKGVGQSGKGPRVIIPVDVRQQQDVRVDVANDVERGEDLRIITLADVPQQKPGALAV